MTSNSGIYRIVVNRSTSGLTQKYYVGHSSDLGKRRRVHFRLLKKGDHPNPAMQAAWQKYGEIAFGFEIVLECSRAELIAAEQAILKKRRMTNQRLDVRYRRSRAAMQREQRRRLAALGDHP